jgi:hypothetical protein
MCASWQSGSDNWRKKRGITRFFGHRCQFFRPKPQSQEYARTGRYRAPQAQGIRLTTLWITRWLAGTLRRSFQEAIHGRNL